MEKENWYVVYSQDGWMLTEWCRSKKEATDFINDDMFKSVGTWVFGIFNGDQYDIESIDGLGVLVKDEI